MVVKAVLNSSLTAANTNLELCQISPFDARLSLDRFEQECCLSTCQVDVQTGPRGQIGHSLIPRPSEGLGMRLDRSLLLCTCHNQQLFKISTKVENKGLIN